ncbi:MAG TPA: NBR1-Ig-like domain-containing protein, partial [Anaerolineales bacterium]|nr:NBR1-Ig-like domain-containing protein [Anaerolineales bacterium]
TALPLPASPEPSATQGFVFIPVLGTSSVSPTPTGTRFTPTANPLTLASGCNNLLLISDVSIPAGTVMRPSETFTKIWKVGNSGTCNWALQYRLVFTGGEQMGGDPSGLGRVIEPTRWTQISIELVAPRRAGTYSGYWRLGTQSGSPFGSTLTVSIVVAAPTNTPQPTLSPTPVTPSVVPSETPSPTNTPVTETATSTTP